MILEEGHHQRLIHGELHGIDAEELVVFHLLDREFIIQSGLHCLDNTLDGSLRVLKNAFVTARIVGHISPRHLISLRLNCCRHSHEQTPRAFVNIYLKNFTLKIQFCLVRYTRTLSNNAIDLISMPNVMNGFLQIKASGCENTKYNSHLRHSQRRPTGLKMKRTAIIISSTAFLLSLAVFACPATASSAFDSHFGIGKDFLLNQNFDMAVKEFGAALAISPNNADVLVERGTAYNGLKKYDLALKDFSAAIKASPNCYLGYNNRGVTYLRLGETEKAIQNFDKAISIDPKQSFAYLNRAGATLSSSGGAASSDKISDWLKLSKWSGEYAGHAAILGALGYRQAKQPALAKALIDQGLAKTDRLKWPYPALQFFAGKLKSKELLDEAERSDYDTTQAHCFLALDLRLKGDPKQAQSHIDWVLKHGIQNSVEYWIAKGLTKPEVGKSLQAPSQSNTAASSPASGKVTNQKTAQIPANKPAQKSGTAKSPTKTK